MMQYEHFQKSELVGLLMAIPITIAAVMLYRNTSPKYITIFLIAILFALGAATFTVIEDIMFHSLFNYLEHICYAITGILFGFGCYVASRKVNNSNENT